MPGAFLHKKSLLDQFGDDYKMVNPIKARRTERQWENPIIRRQREKGIQDWARSFAGKRHYRKLTRFNAMRNESAELSVFDIVEAIGNADIATRSDARPFNVDIDDKEYAVDVWLESKETGEDYLNPSWRVLIAQKFIGTYKTEETGDADVIEKTAYGDAKDIEAFFTKAFNEAAGVKGEAREAKTAWTYLEELGKLEGEESRLDATEKILKALGCNPGTEGRWYDKDGDEIDIIDVLDSTEWAFAQKVCGQLQESKKSEGVTDIPKFVQINTQKDFDKYVRPYIRNPRKHDWAEAEGMWWELLPLAGDEPPTTAKTMSEIQAIDEDPQFAKLDRVGSGDSYEVKIVGKPAKEYAGSLLKYYLGEEEPEEPRKHQEAPRSYPGGVYTVAYIDDRANNPDKVDIYKPVARDLLGLFKHICRLAGYSSYDIKQELEDRTGLSSGEDVTADDVENLLQDLNCGIVRVKGPGIDWSFGDKYDDILDTKTKKSEDSLDDFDNRCRVSPSSKYITFSGLARGDARDDVKRVLYKSGILDPWLGKPGDPVGFGFGVRNNPRSVRKALAALLELGERNTWYIKYNDGDSERNRITMFSPDIPNDMWYAGDVDKIVSYIMPIKSEAVDETLSYEKGHKNSRGEDAPWVIRDHKGGKVLASFAEKADAEAHLERMQHYSKSESLKKALHESRAKKLEGMGSPKCEKMGEIVFEPVVNFKPQQYAVYEIDNDGDELECIFSGTPGGAKKKLGDAIDADPNKKFHVVAIAYTPRGQLADSEVVWSD